MNRLIFIVLLSLISWHCAWAADMQKPYRVVRGEQFAVCQELADILNQPENAGMQAGDQTVAGEYVIPARYTNFKMTKWQPVSKEELAQYIYKDDTKQGFEKLKERYKKTWDGKSDFIFEKTLVNIDNFGPKQAEAYLERIKAVCNDNSPQCQKNIAESEHNLAATKEKKVVLRYRLPNWQQWNCHLSDDAPEGYAKQFNMRVVNKYIISNASEYCQIFLYQGRVFYTTQLFSPDIGVAEPTVIPGYNGRAGTLYKKGICSIDRR